MAKKIFANPACIPQNFTSQYDGYVWPLPSGLIFAGAPPASPGLA